MTLRRSMGLFNTFVLAALAAAVATSSMYGDLSHPALASFELTLVLVLHSLRYLRMWLSRELLLSLGFLGYQLLSLAWTEDMHTAMDTVPALVNCVLVLILFSSLAAYHDVRTLLSGMLAGYLLAVIVYTLTSGFPFSYPEDFSYNTIANMYLIGLFITSLFGTYRHWKILPVALGALLLALIAATTSIKTNLGVILGVLATTLLYFRWSLRETLRTFVVLAVFGGALAYGVITNPTLGERVQNGFGRVSTGFAVLTNREGDSGTTGLGTREGWKKEGLKGWLATPVFGHGVEAFRADFGITSHSTPIDLLYNGGIIGCGLFYSLFASIAWRLLRARNPQWRSLRARIAACLIAYTFMSLSGILYYDSFVAIFLGLSSGLLVRLERGSAGEMEPTVSAAGDWGQPVTGA